MKTISIANCRLSVAYVAPDSQFSKIVHTATHCLGPTSVLTASCMMTRTNNSSTAPDVAYAGGVVGSKT